MKLSYYDRFKCIADKCEITCCQEWKISVDNRTIDRWDAMGVSDCICEKDGDKVIKLNEKRKCPFLSDNKLCDMVINHGEEAIPHACDVFPRQVHDFDNRTEYALVSCCPEVLRLLHETDIYDMTKELLAEEKDFMYNLRNLLIKVLIKSDSVEMGIKKDFFVLKDCLDKEKERSKDKECLEEYNETYLEELTDAISNVPVNIQDTLEEVNELFLDVIENYRKQGMYKKYLDEIAVLAETISEKTVIEEHVAKYEKYRKNIQCFEELFKKYMISELFADGLLPDSDVYELTTMLQWFSMEYSLIKYAVFLKSLCGEKELILEDVMEYMVVISRMMGYSKEDIYEYMEDCFEEGIWEWGYLALIVGV